MPEPITAARLLDLFAWMHALIDAGWAQRDYARNAAGEGREACEPDAVRFCLSGASTAAAIQMGLCEPSVDPTRYRAVQAAAFELLGQAQSTHNSVDLVTYNDHPARRKRDILRLIERAAARVGK